MGVIRYSNRERIAYIGNPGVRVHGPLVGGGASAGLKTNLISWWSLDEESGTRVDSHGSNDLTDNNTVGFAAGKLGNAADFIQANSEYLSVADNPSLSTGDIGFTHTGWVKADLLTGSHSIISKDLPGASARDYQIEFTTLAGGKVNYQMWNGATTQIGQVLSSITPTTGVWYFIVAWHDPDANKLFLQINNGAPDSANTSGVPGDSPAEFRIGSRADNSRYIDGLIDEVGFWKRILTADERTWLYNSGNGRTYSELG